MDGHCLTDHTITRRHLTPAEALAIRELFALGVDRTRLRDRFRASENQVNDALAGRTFAEVDGPLAVVYAGGMHPRRAADRTHQADGD